MNLYKVTVEYGRRIVDTVREHRETYYVMESDPNAAAARVEAKVNSDHYNKVMDYTTRSIILIDEVILPDEES